MVIAGICSDHGYYKGSLCSKCVNRSQFDYAFHVSVYEGHEVEVSPDKRVHIGSLSDEKTLEKRFGIAKYDIVKERARNAKVSRPYELSEKTKKLHGYIKSHGVNYNLVEKAMPQYLREKDASRSRNPIQIQTSR